MLRGLFAALALALACVGEGGDGVSLSGTGSYGPRIIEIDGGRYSCRASVSNNTYRNERDETASGRAQIEIFAYGLSAPDFRGEWRPVLTHILSVIDERAAANVTGTASFAVREGTVSVTVFVEPRARWELACEPDAPQ